MLLDDKDAKLRLSVFHAMTLKKDLETTRKELDDAKLVNLKGFPARHPTY
jgi:hypothetical protein